MNERLHKYKGYIICPAIDENQKLRGKRWYIQSYCIYNNLPFVETNCFHVESLNKAKEEINLLVGTKNKASNSRISN